jgi:hypothetical protein
MKKKVRFHVDPSPLTDRRLLRALKHLARRLKRPLRTSDWDAWTRKPCSSNLVATRFGSWRAALRKAGLPPALRYRYDAPFLINRLESTWRKLGRRPGAHSLQRITGFSNSPYVLRWGSLRRTCELLAAYKRGEITRKQLLKPVPLPKRTVPRKLRYAILKRDDYRCVLCGASAKDGAKLHIDHIIPASKGGGIHPSNLRVLCADCNLGKAAA